MLHHGAVQHTLREALFAHICPYNNSDTCIWVVSLRLTGGDSVASLPTRKPSWFCFLGLPQMSVASWVFTFLTSWQEWTLFSPLLKSQQYYPIAGDSELMYRQQRADSTFFFAESMHRRLLNQVTSLGESSEDVQTSWQMFSLISSASPWAPLMFQ